jgi:SAM-dependent methyltransferase
MKSSRPRPDSHRRERSSTCWCGNGDLKPFSDDYLRCARCETLVLRQMPTKDVTRVRDDSADLYGRNYYLKHLQQDFGYPDLKIRARTDLPERCLHWLRTTLKYKIPPGTALELGSAHGAFVALLRWTGFGAKGLELSPWLVNFAKGVFDVPILSGPIEDQRLAPRSLDVIALMDVLEHLPSPVATMKRCLNLLKADGVLIIQTPRYPEGGSHKDMVARRDPFLEQLKSSDHLYLYSQKSVRKLLRQLGAGHVAFEPAIFAHYDMFLVASPARLSITPRKKIEAVLSATPASRLIQALLDTDDRSRDLQGRLGAADTDRAARLEVILQQGKRTTELEAEVHRWLEEAKKYSAQAQQSESLRAGLNEQASRLIEENKQATARLDGLQVELEKKRSKSESLAHENQVQQAAFAKEKLDLLGQLETAGQKLAAVEAERAHLSTDLTTSASQVTRLQAELEQERGKNEALAGENLDLLGQLEKTRLDLAAVEAERARLSTDLKTSVGNAARLQAELEQERSKREVLAREKLDLLGQLEKTRLNLGAVEAERARLSTDLKTSAGHTARLQAELERQKHANESLAGDLQAAQEKSRVLTARLDAQSCALDGTVKSLEAARARIRELQERLSKIEEHTLVRLLRACHLGPS